MEPTSADPDRYAECLVVAFQLVQARLPEPTDVSKLETYTRFVDHVEQVGLHMADMGPDQLVLAEGIFSASAKHHSLRATLTDDEIERRQHRRREEMAHSSLQAFAQWQPANSDQLRPSDTKLTGPQ